MPRLRVGLSQTTLHLNLKISYSQKQLFFKLHCQKSHLNFWQLSALASKMGQIKKRLFIIVNSKYSELSNKHAANLILFEKIFPPTCLIRAYTFIYFWGKFPPTRLLEPTPLLIWGENPNYKITLSSYFLF